MNESEETEEIKTYASTLTCRNAVGYDFVCALRLNVLTDEFTKCCNLLRK